MVQFRTITRGYCLACFVAGLVQELFPDGESKKVIKAISGLYILLAALYCLSGLDGLQLAWPTAAAAAPMADGSYETKVLAQAQSALEQDCRQQLAALGIPAAVEMQLTQNGDTVSVRSVTIHTAQTLTPEHRLEAEDVAKSYSPQTVTVENTAEGEAADG